MITRMLVCCLLGLSCSGQLLAQYDDGRASLSVIINNEIYPYREFASYVLPAEHLNICPIADDADELIVSAEAGLLDRLEDCRWIWTAPDEPGMVRIQIADANTVLMTLNVFVMVPSSAMRNGSIEGYAIGEYPPPLEDSPIYLPPDGFIRVTQDLLSVNVSPNFKLGQFVSQQDDVFPKFIVLRERLLLKLEVLLESLNDAGVAADSLSIVRGYITPQRSRELGFSRETRHIYGGAASLILDRDGDGRMDDINGDGALNRLDGMELFKFADELFSIPGKEYLQGGLYLYDDQRAATTVLMLDARGFRKRWENSSALPELPAELRPKHKRQFD